MAAGERRKSLLAFIGKNALVERSDGTHVAVGGTLLGLGRAR
jgi:hypothetical protein